MLPSLSCAESEHPTRQNTWICLTLFSYYPTSSCRPANWERKLAPHFRQPDVLPDGGQRSRGFRISSRLSPTIVPRMGCYHAYWNSYTSRLSPTIVPPADSQRSGRERDKLSSIPHYRSTHGSQRSGRGRNKLPSIPHYRSTRW